LPLTILAGPLQLLEMPSSDQSWPACLLGTGLDPFDHLSHLVMIILLISLSLYNRSTFPLIKFAIAF